MIPDRARVLIRFQELQKVQETADCFGANYSTVLKILEEETSQFRQSNPRRFSREMRAARRPRSARILDTERRCKSDLTKKRPHAASVSGSKLRLQTPKSQKRLEEILEAPDPRTLEVLRRLSQSAGLR